MRVSQAHDGTISPELQMRAIEDYCRRYTSLAFTEALHEAGIAGSIGSVGDALDNALVESAHRLLQDRADRPPAVLGRPQRG